MAAARLHSIRKDVSASFGSPTTMVRSPLPRHSGIQCMPCRSFARRHRAMHGMIHSLLSCHCHGFLAVAAALQRCRGALPAAPSGGHKLVAHRRRRWPVYYTTVRRCYQGQDRVRTPSILSRAQRERIVSCGLAGKFASLVGCCCWLALARCCAGAEHTAMPFCFPRRPREEERA